MNIGDVDLVLLAEQSFGEVWSFYEQEFLAQQIDDHIQDMIDIARGK